LPVKTTGIFRLRRRLHCCKCEARNASSNYPRRPAPDHPKTYSGRRIKPAGRLALKICWQANCPSIQNILHSYVRSQGPSRRIGRAAAHGPCALYARIKVSRPLMGDFFATSYNFWKSSHYPGRAHCHARIKGSRSLRVCRSITSFFYSLIMYIMVPTESEERHGYS